MVRYELRGKSSVCSYNCSEDHAVEFKVVQLVAGQSLLHVRLDHVLDQRFRIVVGVRPHLLHDSVQPFAALNVGEVDLEGIMGKCCY